MYSGHHRFTKNISEQNLLTANSETKVNWTLQKLIDTFKWFKLKKISLVVIITYFHWSTEDCLLSTCMSLN